MNNITIPIATMNEMKRMIIDPDEVQVKFENKMDKELFLDRFKNLYFNCNYSLQEAIEESNRNINLTEKDIKEILEIIVQAAV